MRRYFTHGSCELPLPNNGGADTTARVPISARPRRGRPNKRKLLVIFIFFRACVGLLHDIAPSAQGFSDAGKPRFFGGRKTVHVVTDFVEHIDDAVDPLERLRDFYRRRHFSSFSLEKRAPDELRL